MCSNVQISLNGEDKCQEEAEVNGHLLTQFPSSLLSLQEMSTTMYYSYGRMKKEDTQAYNLQH